MSSRRRMLAAIGVGLIVVGVSLVVASRDDGKTPAVLTLDRTTSTSTTTTTTTTTTTEPSTTTPSTTTTTAAAVTTARPAPATTAPAPPFASSISTVTAAELGASWRDGCPVGVEQLRVIGASIWGYDGRVHNGRIVVHEAEVGHVVAALHAIYDGRFPIQRMEPIAAFGGDDQASMRANNTSGFNCRYVAGTTRWSEHAFGRAIDVNPLMNPYVRGSKVDPPEGAPYADRRRRDQGMVHGGDAAVRAFAAQGWAWGGYWSSGKDYQHFSASGR